MDGDVVADAVFGIEEKAGAGLEAAAQGYQQTGRHVLLRQADGLGAGAVHVHRHLRKVEGLLNAHVRRAGNVTDLVGHAFGQSPVAVEIRADDLEVDGR